jgi:hypothetical protein
MPAASANPSYRRVLQAPKGSLKNNFPISEALYLGLSV